MESNKDEYIERDTNEKVQKPMTTKASGGKSLQDFLLGKATSDTTKQNPMLQKLKSQQTKSKEGQDNKKEGLLKLLAGKKLS
jgi:hypothetical protein